MQHYLANDKMLTIHADRLIKGWEVKDAIEPSDVKPLFDYTLEKCPCFDNAGREIPSLFHIERRNPNTGRGEILPIGGFGPNYTILQHSEMLDFVASIIPELPGTRIEMAEKAPMAYSLAISRRHEVIAQWEGGETAQTFTKDSAWKLVNAFTFPIFNPAKMSKGTDASGIRYDGLFGDRAEKVSNILATVERLAA